MQKNMPEHVVDIKEVWRSARSAQIKTPHGIFFVLCFCGSVLLELAFYEIAS